MCDIDVDDPCEVWKETRHTARKEHACDCCGGRIKPRDVYTRIFMISDGCPSVERECASCSAMMALFKQHHRNWWNPGMMRDALQECVREERVYDADRDEYVPSDIGKLWVRELEAMDARRSEAA